MLPDFADPVLAFRDFRLDRGRLWSPHRTTEWKQGPQRAECTDPKTAHHPDEVPSNDCKCGWYGYGKIQSRHEVYRQSWICEQDETYENAGVLAGIKMWGRMEVHTHIRSNNTDDNLVKDLAFRSEWAELVAMVAHTSYQPEHTALLQAVADYYQVQLVDFDQLEEYASRFGKMLPLS